jgi:excisionase family DNA binding protein
MRVLTPEQCAELLQVPPRTVREICARGEMVGRGRGARKVGRAWRIPESVVTSAEVRDRVALECPRFGDGARGFVYFLAAIDGPIKIGFARDVSERLAALQIANPHPLRLLASLPGTVRLERALHRRFAEHRLRGEWFRPAPELLECVAKAGGLSS